MNFEPSKRVQRADRAILSSLINGMIGSLDLNQIK